MSGSRFIVAGALGCLLGLAGCTMEPHYQRPDAPIAM